MTHRYKKTICEKCGQFFACPVEDTERKACDYCAGLKKTLERYDRFGNRLDHWGMPVYDKD